jgi:hypothetical protein
MHLQSLRGVCEEKDGSRPEQQGKDDGPRRSVAQERSTNT